MFRFRLAVGQLAILALTVALVVPGTLAGAMGATARQPCEQYGQPCNTGIMAACCCCTGPAEPAAPGPLSSGQAAPAGVSLTSSAVPVVVVALTSAESQASSLLRRHAPPHGYACADLPIFLSTLLI